MTSMTSMRVNVLVRQTVGVHLVISSFSLLNLSSLLKLKTYGITQFREGSHFFVKRWSPILEKEELEKVLLFIFSPVKVSNIG